MLLAVISCTKENTANHSSTVAQSTEKALTFTIGQRYGGGIIFYIDSTGQHGLIADTADLPQSKWAVWNGIYTETGATKTKIGSGYSDTRKIILSQGDSGTYAARRCWNLIRNGYTDWFLPSKDELNELYKQKSVVGGFADDREYWSSSESLDYRYAWGQYFHHGVQDYAYAKGLKNHVRAVRAF